MKRISIISGTDVQWLKEASEAGLLSHEAEIRCRKVLEANRQLKRDNAQLRARVKSQSSTIAALREMHLNSMMINYGSEPSEKGVIAVWVVCGIFFALSAFLLISELFR